MKPIDLDIAYMRRQRCSLCKPKRTCVDCWRDFLDATQIISRTFDKKRAKA